MGTHRVALAVGFLPLEWIAYSRVMAALAHPYYASGSAVKALHWVLSPLKAAVFKAFELIISLQTPLPGRRSLWVVRIL